MGNQIFQIFWSGVIQRHIKCNPNDMLPFLKFQLASDYV